MHGTSAGNGTVVQPANRSTTELTWVIVVYLLLMAAIIVGNALVIGAFAYERRLRTTTTTLIIGLSVADLLVGLALVPCWLVISAGSHLEYRHHTQAFYHFYITTDIFIGCASVLQLTSISIERYHAILYPMKHRLLTTKVFYIALAAAWLYAGIIAFLEPVQYGKWERVYTILTVVTCFLFPLIIISVAYVKIFRAAKSANENKYLNRNRSTFRKERRLSLTVAFITILFVITWLPLFSLSMMATFDPQLLPGQATTSRLVDFVKWMHYSNSCLNPFLYSYRNPRIKRTIHNMMCKLLGKKDQARGDSLTSVWFRRNSSNVRRTNSSRSIAAASRKTSTTSNPDKNNPKRKTSETSTKGDHNNNAPPFVIQL